MKWLLLLLWLSGLAFAAGVEGTWEGVQDEYQLRLMLSADGTFESSADAQFTEEVRQGFC